VTAGNNFSNVIAERPGKNSFGQVIIIGAHYDSHKNSPGANDNASGVAAMLELARAAASWRLQNTLRFVAFTNEESPFTRLRHMGELGLCSILSG
jgi:Zn-dependent M28 family amino/carboxypeptidase